MGWGKLSTLSPRVLTGTQGLCPGKELPFFSLILHMGHPDSAPKAGPQGPNDLEPEWPFKGLPPPATVDSCRLMENSNNICS